MTWQDTGQPGGLFYNSTWDAGTRMAAFHRMATMLVKF